MKKKIRKITVGTRITLPQRDELEEEARMQGMSFCAYLEYLLMNRSSEINGNNQIASDEELLLVRKERDELIAQVNDLKEVIIALEEEHTEDEEFEGLDDPERQELLDQIQALETKVNELEELNELLQTLEEEAEDYEEDDLQTLLDEVETEKSELESTNQALVAKVDLLQEELTKQKNHSIDSDAMIYLQEKHPDLSKDEIVKIALDCTATNDGRSWYNEMFSFTDYIKREKSFVHLQNNEV